MKNVTITDALLLERFKSMHPDGMSIFMMGGGAIRGAFFHGTRFVNQMRAQHNLGILESLVLGQACLCGALLIPTMKGRDRAVFRYDTKGPAVGFCVEAMSEGAVRGYLFQDPIPITEPLTNWDLSPFFGEGIVSVTRYPEGFTEPVTGSVEATHQNIALDLSEYFLKSEQTKSGFTTGIQFDTEGRIIGAGALFIQAMPGCPDGLLDIAERAFSAAPSLGQWFAEGGNREDIIFGLFRELSPEVLLERAISFYCPCEEEKFLNHIKTLPKSELKSMYENDPDPIEVYCHNCGSVYTYPLNLLKDLF